MNHDNVRGAVCVANSQVCRGGALPPPWGPLPRDTVAIWTVSCVRIRCVEKTFFQFVVRKAILNTGQNRAIPTEVSLVLFCFLN